MKYLLCLFPAAQSVKLFSVPVRIAAKKKCPALCYIREKHVRSIFL